MTGLTDHQSTLLVIVLLVLAVIAFGGFRSARKGRMDDSLFTNYDKRLADYDAELTAIRAQMEKDRQERISAEDAARAREVELQRRVGELEGKLYQSEFRADARRQQLEAAGLVPVV